MAPYNADEGVKVSMLWTEGGEFEGGFREIRALKNITTTLNGLGGKVKEGTWVGVFASHPHYPESVWKMEHLPYHC